MTLRIGVVRFAPTPRRPRQYKPKASPSTWRCSSSRFQSNAFIQRATGQFAWRRRPTADANGMAWCRLVDRSDSEGRRGCSSHPAITPTSSPWSHPLLLDRVEHRFTRQFLPPDSHAERGVGAWMTQGEARHGEPWRASVLEARRPMRRTLRHDRPRRGRSQPATHAPAPPATSPPILDACCRDRPRAVEEHQGSIRPPKPSSRRAPARRHRRGQACGGTAPHDANGRDRATTVRRHHHRGPSQTGTHTATGRDADGKGGLTAGPPQPAGPWRDAPSALRAVLDGARTLPPLNAVSRDRNPARCQARQATG